MISQRTVAGLAGCQGEGREARHLQCSTGGEERCSSCRTRRRAGACAARNCRSFLTRRRRRDRTPRSWESLAQAGSAGACTARAEKLTFPTGFPWWPRFWNTSQHVVHVDARLLALSQFPRLWFRRRRGFGRIRTETMLVESLDQSAFVLDDELSKLGSSPHWMALSINCLSVKLFNSASSCASSGDCGAG